MILNNFTNFKIFNKEGTVKKKNYKNILFFFNLRPAFPLKSKLIKKFFEKIESSIKLF